MTESQIVTLDGELDRLSKALVAAGTTEDIDALVNDAGEMLGAVYAQAEQVGDQQAMTHLSLAWERSNALAERAKHGVVTARALSAAMQTTLAQRDKAVTELKGVVDAIRDWDSSHEVVGDAIEAIGEQMEMDAYEYASESLVDDLLDGIATSLNVGYTEAAEVYDAFTTGVVDSEVLDKVIALLQAKRAAMDEE